MIVSSGPSPSGARATVINSGKGTIYSSTYTGFKQLAKVYGFYKDIKPYLPETHLDRYRYKPQKRVAGYLGQAFHAKKEFRHASSYQLNQKCSRSNGQFWSGNSKSPRC